ncbi:MAG: SPOR domain-containing protein, partial [Gammaproteobacteria bacterium]|nr:SPOR domain-containing protein [Gammaproteobacteria bacterium]
PADNLTKSWMIQLASFTAKQNAQSLQNTVAKMGYSATIETTNAADTTYYRVRIGPESNKQQVDKIVADIVSQLKINPQVISQ